MGHALDVPWLDDRARVEAADDLAEPPDVVHDRGNAGSEGLEERSREVDLGPVREEPDGRLGEGALELGAREEAEAPLGAPRRPLTELVEGHAGVADDEEPGPLDAEHGLDGVLSSLVRSDEPERERGAAIVATGDVGAEDGMRDDPDLLPGNAEGDERVPAALRVDDDAREAREELPPEPPVARCSPRDDVVSREDERRTGAEEEEVELGHEPLDVEDVRA
ncbi:MAG: hypothetical protein NZL88_08980 [Gaiellaceae bacterium]|nr:hypothetical protein [Gaiellaceae bacterium]